MKYYFFMIQKTVFYENLKHPAKRLNDETTGTNQKR